MDVRDDLDSATSEHDGDELAVGGPDLTTVTEDFLTQTQDSCSRMVSGPDEFEPLGSIFPQPKQIRPQPAGTLSKGTRIVAFGGGFPVPLVVEKGPGWIPFQEKLGVITRALTTPKE